MRFASHHRVSLERPSRNLFRPKIRNNITEKGTMQKLARKLRKSAKDVYGGDEEDIYSLPTRDDSRPIDIQEQEELVRSLEMIHAQQSLLWRSVFTGLVSCYMVFLVYSMFQQAYSPWDLKYHAYFMNEIDSGSIVAAEIVAVLVCLMIITGLMHSSKRHRLWLWYSFLPGTLLAIFWLHHMLRLADFRWEILWLPLAPLGGAAVCLYVDGLLSESSEEVRKLRGYMISYAQLLPSFRLDIHLSQSLLEWMHLTPWISKFDKHLSQSLLKWMHLTPWISKFIACAKGP